LNEHINDENTTVALLARLYNSDMPPLRIGDWVHAFVGPTKTLNEIDLKKKIMVRRIKKNQKKNTEDIIPLPASLIKFIKDRGIKGELFPDMSVTQIDNLLKKTYPGKKATPHIYRSLYTVNILSKLTDKEEILSRLKIMDHSLEVNARYYNKQNSSAYQQLLSGK
jgi:integrase